IPKKVETPAVLAIREGKIQKDKKKLKGAKGKDKGKNKLAYTPKPKIPSPLKRDNPAKDSVCHHYKEVGHYKRNCLSYQAELKKRKNASVASIPGIFTIELNAFPNKTWVYDTGCGTHICNTSQGLRGSRKLKHGALSLYVGNGMRAIVEAIGNFDLVLPSGLIIVLDNCHFAPTMTRGTVSISRLVNNDYIHTFTNYGISVLKDNMFYFNAIPRDGIYEIDMHNLYPNVSSMFNVSNKRAKHALDSFYLWHCCLGHINKKRMDKLQHNKILIPKGNDGLLLLLSTREQIFVARNVEFFENSLMIQEASRSHGLLKLSGSDGVLELIQEKDTQPFENTSEVHNEVEPIEVEPQNVKVPIRRFARIPQAPDRYGFYVDVEEYEIGDLNEPPNYKDTLSDPEFNKWLEAMNTEMQSMKDNQV
ncbi:zinc finger, CCHC-type containing protein, partial [Tanacetum coccineum]